MTCIAKKTLPIIACLIFFMANAQEDSVLYAKDSVIEIEQSCYEKFFEMEEQIPSPEKITIITNEKKTMALAAFRKEQDFSNFSLQCLSDMDADGKKELLLWNYTGGAHCCDELYIFTNIGPNKYQYAAKTFAGHVCINDNKEIIYDFYELFGYFFTCYACALDNSSDNTALSLVSTANLKYSKGKLNVVPGNKGLKEKITANLSLLNKYPYQPMQDDMDQDDGLRKEFALNLVVYYYSFGKNITETKNLFDKYYRFSDAKKVWSKFQKILNGVKGDNDF